MIKLTLLEICKLLIAVACVMFAENKALYTNKDEVQAVMAAYHPERKRRG